MNSFVQIIAGWPSIQAFADDLGVQPGNVRAWRDRDSIPAEWFLRLVRAAAARGLHGISLDLLATLAEQRPRAKGSDRTPAPADQAA